MFCNINTPSDILPDILTSSFRTENNSKRCHIRNLLKMKDTFFRILL